MNVNPSSLLSRYGSAWHRRPRATPYALAAALLAGAPAAAFGFVEIARGELILNTTLRGAYDSNVSARQDSASDVYVSLIPELQYLRRAGRGTIDARAGVDFTRFQDLSNEDHEDFYTSLDVTLPTHQDSPLSGGVRLAFTEHTGVNEFLNRRLKTENYLAEADLLYRVSERLSLRNSYGYNTQRSTEASNVESYHARFGAQHEYSETLAFFSDYRIRRMTSSGRGNQQRVDNLDHAIFVGAIGDIGPRLTGTASAGVQRTNSRGPRGADANMIVAATEVAWEMRPRTDLTLTISRDMDVSPNDFTAEMFNTTLGIDHRIEPKIELTGYTGYSRFRFRGGDNRTDEGIHLGAGAQYNFSDYWDAGINYQFTNNDSNRAFADYSRHITSLSTRYSF